MKKDLPRVCQTASGVLIVDGRVLLIKHKKMGTWMTPGGHLEEGEFLHEAAQREFFEETALKVKAIDSFAKLWNIDSESESQRSQFQPAPIAVNLHWISKENYQARLAQKKSKDSVWSNGCEQHLDFKYIVQAEAGLDFKQNTEETDGIAWFSLAEIEKMPEEEIFQNVRAEIILAFKLL